MFNRGVLDEITFDYLIKGNQNYYGQGYMHILPKILIGQFVNIWLMSKLYNQQSAGGFIFSILWIKSVVSLMYVC
jgi:hypothetical protein